MPRLTAAVTPLLAVVAGVGCDRGEWPRSQEFEQAAGDAGSGGAAEQPTAATTGGAAGEPASGTQRRYATQEQGVFPKDRVLDVQVTMPPEAWTTLIATAKQETWSTAAVTIDGQRLGEIGFRPKGEYSLDSCIDDTGQLICDKLSFKLKFSEVDPDKRFHGLKRLVLNQIHDGWGLYVETLAYQIFNSFGITAPRTSYAVLTVNGESLGIYRVVEAVDGRFTDLHFSDHDGNLYKEAWPVSNSDGYFQAALKTNEETASNDAFIAFSADMLAASDDELPQTLAKYMDLDRMLDYMAVDYAIANWDGITTFYAGSWGHSNHNYYMYQDVDAPRFTLIPWDLNAVLFLDHWLGDIEPWDTLDVDCDTPIPTEDGDLGTLPAACDPTIRALALSRDGYHASVRRLLDEVFVVDKLSDQIDEYARQVSPVMHDDPFVPYTEVSLGAQYVKSALGTMRSRLEAVLNEGDTGGGGAGSE